MKEETDLDVKPLGVLGVYEFDLDNNGENTHRFTIYSTEIVSGDVKLSEEHIEYRWATRDEICKLKTDLYFEPFFKEHL